MKIDIIGAGMAGLLAANMLRRHGISMFEMQDNLPNNHHAVLRFRSAHVGEVLGIQFKKVNMIKTYIPHMNMVADSLAYSRKTTGQFTSDRSIIEGTVTAERYIAPSDLIRVMSDGIYIFYGKEYEFKKKNKRPIISTMPMPVLMKKLGYKTEELFRTFDGIVATATIENCNAYVSVLIPMPSMRASRATITGNQLMIEFPGKDVPEAYEIAELYQQLGLYDAVIRDMEFKKQKYFKILPINDVERHKFMKWATVNHNVYSLGRYACWRPKLLLDDLVKDIRIIESWIIGGKQ